MRINPITRRRTTQSLSLTDRGLGNATVTSGQQLYRFFEITAKKIFIRFIIVKYLLSTDQKDAWIRKQYQITEERVMGTSLTRGSPLILATKCWFGGTSYTLSFIQDADVKNVDFTNDV